MSPWLELRVAVRTTEVEQLSMVLIEAGAVGLQEDVLPGTERMFRQPWDTEPAPEPEEVWLRAWWDSSRPVDLELQVETVLNGWGRVGEPEWVEQVEEDWAVDWKAQFRAIRISERLVVAPPWEAQEGDLVIEPGMAFGTGEHPSTRACLEAIDRLASPGMSCLDVGMGSGVLALAAAQRGMRVRGVDIDADSVRTARANADRNDLVAEFDDTPLGQVGGRFDLVVANIYAEVLVQLAPDLQRVLGGRLVLAGILQDRAGLVEEALRDLRLVQRSTDGDWVCLELEP
ncbi:MAG: 50S ribosomal protein L11 methyltransferase [Myxococcota bacterium]|jgi:ribosomal protein L11 methyltransferase|nr:50S ribosomal protein L11 methyltransferase [Myxococcota bacterium]